jgi:hypothetical protein
MDCTTLHSRRQKFQYHQNDNRQGKIFLEILFLLSFCFLTHWALRTPLSLLGCSNGTWVKKESNETWSTSPRASSLISSGATNR